MGGENGKVSYLDIVKHYENCFRLHGDCCKGVDWPDEADAEKRYGVMLGLIEFDRIHPAWDSEISVLDFGCGLGHLYGYIGRHGFNYKYTGMDVSEMFIERCREKYPDGNFLCTDILKDNRDFDGQYDYIISNGVFTEKRELDYGEMLDYFKKMLQRLYAGCRCGLAFNVMSKDVSWERDDLFHLPLSDLSRFLAENISRDYIIRNDYGLYEYTVYIYKRKG